MIGCRSFGKNLVTRIVGDFYKEYELEKEEWNYTVDLINTLQKQHRYRFNNRQLQLLDKIKREEGKEKMGCDDFREEDFLLEEDLDLIQKDCEGENDVNNLYFNDRYFRKLIHTMHTLFDSDLPF